MYTPSTIVQGPRTWTRNWNKQKWCYCQSKNFSGISNTTRHLKTFRIISNEMPDLLLIQCWWYFSCLQMYSNNFFNIYFHEQMLFQIFVAKVDTGQFLRNNSLWIVQVSLTNSHSSPPLSPPPFQVSWRS